MANATIRGRTAIWGIVADAADTYYAGIIVNQTRQLESDKDFVLDNEAFAIAEVFFNTRDECDINVLCESGTTPPDPSDDIQIAGVACICQSSQVKWEQKGWKMLNVKATKFANLVP